MQLLYIHDKGLGDNQPIFSRMTPTQKLYLFGMTPILKNLVKRLVFIYETLISMPVEIVHGKTLEIVKNSKRYTLHL